MSEFNWRATISFNNKSADFAWEEVFITDPKTQKQESIGYWSSIKIPGTDEPFTDFDKSFTEKGITAAASALRRSQVFPSLPKSSIFKTVDVEASILSLFSRCNQGEYLGQTRNSQDVLYVQDVAAITDFTFSYVLEQVDSLVEKGLIGLTGMILISHETYEEDFAHWYKVTGHRRLTVSDWGYWSCAACGKSGDPEDEVSVKNVPCE